MFYNIGQKIKALAVVITWIGIVLSVIAGFVVSSTGDWQMGIIIVIAGGLGSWLMSFLLYGFGQLIYNTDILVCHFCAEDGEEEERCFEARNDNNGGKDNSEEQNQNPKPAENSSDEGEIVKKYYDETL